MDVNAIKPGEMYAVDLVRAVKRMTVAQVATTGKVTVHVPGDPTRLEIADAAQVLRPWQEHQKLKRDLPDAFNRLVTLLDAAGISTRNCTTAVQKARVCLELEPADTHALTGLLAYALEQQSRPDGGALGDLLG